jgi:hypothetical protein
LPDAGRDNRAVVLLKDDHGRRRPAGAVVRNGDERLATAGTGDVWPVSSVR